MSHDAKFVEHESQYAVALLCLILCLVLTSCAARRVVSSCELDCQLETSRRKTVCLQDSTKVLTCTTEAQQWGENCANNCPQQITRTFDCQIDCSTNRREGNSFIEFPSIWLSQSYYFLPTCRITCRPTSPIISYYMFYYDGKEVKRELLGTIFPSEQKEISFSPKKYGLAESSRVLFLIIASDEDNNVHFTDVAVALVVNH